MAIMEYLIKRTDDAGGERHYLSYLRVIEQIAAQVVGQAQHIGSEHRLCVRIGWGGEQHPALIHREFAPNRFGVRISPGITPVKSHCPLVVANWYAESRNHT